MALKVSVIVPTFNRADLIAQSLESILNQSHRPAEVIVVDDGSTDQTQAVVQRFANSVKYLRIENSGPTRARNVGVEASGSEWIAFCDSDDLWHPEKLAAQVHICEKMPDLQYCFTNFKTVADGAWSVETKFDTSPPGYWDMPRRELGNGSFAVTVSMFDRLLCHQPIFPSTVLIKRALIDRVGGWDEALGRLLSEDLEFTLRCVVRPPVGVVSQPLVGIRKHVGNISGNALRQIMAEVEILRYVREHHPAAKEHARLIEDEVIRRRTIAAALAFENGNFETVRQVMAEVPRSSVSWRLQLKSFIAQCPGPLARPLRRAAMRLSGGNTRSER